MIVLPWHSLPAAHSIRWYPDATRAREQEAALLKLGELHRDEKYVIYCVVIYRRFTPRHNSLLYKKCRRACRSHPHVAGIHGILYRQSQDCKTQCVSL